MSKKVSLKRKKFTIIPEANRVVGKMVEKTPLDYKDYSELSDVTAALIDAALIDNLMSWVTNEGIIKATAVCDPKDEFDEKIGMDVCSAKLEMKNHKKIARSYIRASEQLREAADRAEDLFNKHFDKMWAIRQDLKEYYGGHYEEDN